MMNNEFYGLNSVYFFNSALFECEKVELSGNTFVYGTQGAGKTTVLNMVNFFYTGNQEVLKKENKVFFDYYFRSRNSYVVFVVSKETHDVIVTLYRKENTPSEAQNRILFRFSAVEKGSYDIESIFARSREDMFNSLREVEIESIEAKNNKQYLRILYGAEAKVKNTNLFSISKVKNYQNFSNLLYSILKNSAISSKSVKNTFIEAIEEQSSNYAVIDLAEYEKDINRFQEAYEGIIEWNKNLETIDQIDNLFIEAESNKSSKKSLLEKLHKSYHYIEASLPALKADIKNRQATKDEKDGVLQVLREQHQQEQSRLNRELGALEQDISGIKEKFNDYEKQDIEKILLEVNKEGEYKNELEAAKLSLEALSGAYQDLSQRNDKLRAVIEKHAQKERTRLEIEYRKRKEQIYSSALTKREEVDSKISTVEEEYRKQIQPQKDILTTNKKTLDQKERNVAVLLNQKVGNTEVYKKYESEIKKLESQIVNIKSEIRLNEQKEKTFLAREESFIEKHDQERTTSFDKFTRSIERIQNEIDMLKGIANTDGSLYQKLNELGLDASKYYQVLKDEVLASEDFSYLGENATGRNIIFDFELSKESELLVETASIAERIKTLDSEKKSIIAEREKKKKAFKKEERSFYDQHNQDVKALRENISSQKRQIKDLENTLENSRQESQSFQESWKKQQTEKIEVLNQEISEIKVSVKTLEETISSLENEKNKAIAALKKSYIQTSELVEQLKSDYQNKLSEIERKREIDLSKREKEYNKELKKGGFSAEKTQSLEKSIQELEKKLQFINQHKILVAQYVDFMEKKYKRLGEYKERLQKESRKLQNIKQAHSDEEKKLSELINKMENEIRNLRSRETEYQKEKNDMDNYIETLPEDEFDVYKSFSAVPLSDFQPERLNDLLPQLNSVRKNIKKAEESIANIVNTKWSLFVSKGFAEFETSNPLLIAKYLIEMKNENWIKGYTDTTYQRIDTVMNGISRQNNRIYDAVSDIKSLTRKVNRQVENIKTIELIKKIEIRVEEKNNKIIDSLKSLSTYWAEHQDTINGNLFGDYSNSANLKPAILGLLNDFTDALKELDDKNKKITVDDLFDLKFHVIEKANDDGWRDNISEAGSTGTAIIIKLAVNAALIKITSGSNRDFSVHIMVDETGKLEKRNVAKIIRYVNDEKIKVIAAQPNTGVDEYFTNSYHFNPVSDKKTRIKKYLKRKVSLKGIA